MRKRRFLAWLMTMVMAIGLMPATALADDSLDAAPVTSVSTESDNPIQITKSVNKDGNAITMEAYVTNEVTMQDKSKPMDIVLVLDVSGSMANNITSYQYVATQSQGWSYNNINKGDYYYKDGENYYKVSAERKRDWFNQTYWLEANGQQLGGTSTSKSATLYTGVLYTRQTASSVTKIAALQSAVNNFIDSVAKDAAANNVEHRISIVKFAGTKNNVVGDDKYDSGQYKYNYSQIVKTLTEVSGDGAGNLKTAVNKLTAAGATSADYGLELANTVLTNRPQENGKAVVMFTDGEPNHGNGFDGSVAATAVNTAKNLKDSGAKVFTVGVFDQTYSDDSNVGKYMNAVSSNYPSATANGGWNNLSMGTRAEGNFYYTASNAGELDDVFQSISEEISNLTVTADANAVLTDTLSDKFEFGAAVGDGSGVIVKKVPVTGKTKDGYTWGFPEDVTEVTVTVNKETGKIDVNGFDYTSKDNAVTAKTENGKTTYSGYKLVLTFPIAPKADADWEKGIHYYDTNKNKTAGLTNIKKDNESASELLTDSPQVPVTAYGVTYDANGGQNPPTDAKGYLSGTEATVLGAGSMTKAGYTFTGWKDAADTDYEVDGKITMTRDVTLTAQWIPKGQLSINKDRVESDQGLPQNVASELEGKTVEYGNVEIPYAGSVTLLYKVTVTNTTPTTLSLRTPVVPAGGNAYTVVEDDGATYVGYYAVNGVAAPTSEEGTTVSGVLGPDESIDLYFTKTFVANDVETSNTDATVVTNTATLGEGKPADTVETPAVVKVTVTFDTQGGSAVASQTFDKGGKATKPDDPTRTNYKFAGWFEANSSTAFDFDTEVVNEDKTLYAHWQLNPPTAEQLGDIALEVICDQHDNKDCDAVYPSLTEATEYSKTGFIIGEVEGKTVKVTLKGADLFIPSEHFADEGETNITELTFEYDDDTETWSPVDGTHVVAVRTDIFVPGFAIYVTAEEEIVPAEKVNINFHPGEADTEENYGKMPFVQVEKGSEYTITPNLYEYEGYSFVNWKVLSTAGLEDTYYDDKDTIDSVETSMTLVAQWEPIDVKIKFDPNASSLLVSGEMDDQTVKYGVEATLNKNQFERIDGYAFVGWNTQPDGEGTSYTDKASITVSNVEGITLYAQWEYASVVLTYYANGGSGIMWPETYSKGAKVTVKECAFKAPTGQEFVGWSTTATGDVDYYPGETIDGIEKPMQLYAIWKGKTPVPSQYILTYHANDGSGNKKEETYLTTDDLVIVKDDNMFSMFGKPVGKKFTGWSFSANGNAEVKPGDMFLIRQNTDLYAVWEDIEGVSVQKTIENKQEGPYQFGDEVTFRIVVRNDSDETVNDLLLVEKPGDGLKPVEDVEGVEGVEGGPWSWDAAREHLMVPIMLLHGFIEDILDLADEPVVDEPVVDESVVDEPVVDEPKAEAPVVEGPKAEAPVVDEPVADEPVVDEPVADEPVVDEPVADEPVVDEPVADEPAEEVEVDEVTETPAAMLAFEDPERNDAYLVKAEDGSLYVVIPELEPGEEIEFYYTVEVVDTHEAYDPADYTNKAYIDGIKDAKDEVLVPVTGIEIEKTVEKNRKPEPGEWVIYEIVVTNTGAFDLADVTVTEIPEDGFVDGYFCDENGKEDKDAKDATTYIIGELGAGDDVTLYYRAKVSSKAKDGDELCNDVTVVGTLDNDEKVMDTDSNDEVIVKKESHGGIPSKDRPTKPSKVEEVLNTEDHFQYVQGYPDNTVGPERNITRAEATVIFFRLLNDSVRAEYLDAENAFPDVNMNDWFNLGVSTMENGGFVSGYDDGLFRPNANITRAELATIISNFDDLEPAAENKFADVEGHWAEKYINSAAEKGWLSGYEDGLFRPNQYITRAETMSMINRVLDRRVDADGLHAAAKQWKDNPESKWYYYAVLEATNYHEYERANVSDYENWTAIKAEKIWEN